MLARNTTHNAPITHCIKEKQSFSSPKKKIELKTRATNSQILKNLIHPTSTTLTHKKHPILKITTPTSTYGLPKVPRPHLHTVSQTSHAYIYIRSPKSPTPTSTYGHPKVPRPHLHTVSQTSHAHIYIRSPKNPTPTSRILVNPSIIQKTSVRRAQASKRHPCGERRSLPGSPTTKVLTLGQPSYDYVGSGKTYDSLPVYSPQSFICDFVEHLSRTIRDEVLITAILGIPGFYLLSPSTICTLFALYVKKHSFPKL